MKICYVSFEYPPQFGGGIGTYVSNISRVMSEEHEVHVLTFNPGNLKSDENDGRVFVHRIAMDSRQIRVIDGTDSEHLSTLLFWSLYSEKVYTKLKELHRSVHFDVVEFPDYRGEGYFAMLSKRIHGEFHDVELVVRLHTPLIVLNKYNLAKSTSGMDQLVNFENTSILLCDHLVSPSKILGQVIIKELGCSKKVVVIPHPIEDNLLAAPLELTNSNEVLYVGRLERRKGVETLVQAMLPLLRKYPQMQLKMIGGDTNSGPQGTSMRDYLISLIPHDLLERVAMLDRLPREELVHQYSQSRLCVFPSLFENFPNVCLEAMAAGSPVVVGSNTGMAEMLDDTISGFVFRSGDVDDLRNKIDIVYSLGDDARLSVISKAKDRVRNNYVPNVIVKTQEHYFSSIVHPRISRVNKKYTRGLVSVVIPCYNHGEFLPAAVESVQKNSYGNHEVIVVNDGSTDPETIQILENLGTDVIVINQQNSGLSAARNAGVSHSQGEYVVVLDADDMIKESFIEKSVKALEENPDVGFVYTYVEYFGATTGIWKTPKFDANLLLVSNLCVATAMYRRVCFDEVGGYSTDMVYGFEDWDFWIYIVERGWAGLCIEEPLFLYRQHHQSMLTSSQKNRPFLIEKMIDHHMESYQRSLKYVLVEKDRQFFDAHMSNYINYERVESITGSRFWKLFQRLRDAKRGIIGFVGIGSKIR